MSLDEIVQVVADACSTKIRPLGFERIENSAFEREVLSVKRLDRLVLLGKSNDATKSPPWNITALVQLEFPEVTKVLQKFAPIHADKERVPTIQRNIGYLTDEGSYSVWSVHDEAEAFDLAAKLMEVLPRCEKEFWQRFGTFDRIEEEFESSRDAKASIDDDVLIAIKCIQHGVDEALRYLRTESRMAKYSRNEIPFKRIEHALEAMKSQSS